MPKGSPVPELFDEAVVRSKDVIELVDKRDITDTTAWASDSVACGSFRHFLLMLNIDSTSTPTTLHIELQFLSRWDGQWHTLKQGPFAALFYEDGDTASGIQECFEGMCAGREMRLLITGVGTTSNEYFTITAALEFFN